LGAYPAISLKEAGKWSDFAKEQLAHGIDPGAHKKAVKESKRAEALNNFEVIARERFNKFSADWSESNKVKILARLENNIIPFLGGKTISHITPPELLEVMRCIEKRGALETAHRALQDCGRIFRYAIATGRADRDPAADLKGALPPAKGNSFAAITDPKEVSALLRAIEAYNGYPVVVLALRLAPLLFVRPGEPRQAEWEEININAQEWRIPAAKMKMRQVHLGLMGDHAYFLQRAHQKTVAAGCGYVLLGS
jgi:integrase